MRALFFFPLAFVLVLASAGLVLAHRAQDALPPPVPGDVGVVILQEDAGRTFTVGVNERFAIALQGVPSAGYVWEPRSMPSFLTRAGEMEGPTLARHETQGVVGARRWSVFLFAATKAGAGDVWLAHRRPFEGDRAAWDAVQVRIVAE